MDCLLFLLFKKKKKKDYVTDWVWKYYTKHRTNSVKPHQNPIDLVFLRSKSTCEENVFPKGEEGPGIIINVKEP